MNGLSLNEDDRNFLYAALGHLVDRIERCGASTELTDAVSFACDLRAAIGNQYNKPNIYMENRVRSILMAHAVADGLQKLAAAEEDIHP